jgi:hypothetical protein
MSLDTYIVEGGIGKCVCFTALLPKLAEKAGGPVQILTPYIDVFANNPLVKMVFDQGSIPLDDPRILASDNIYYSEPYKSNFVKGEEHLLQSYSRLHGIKFDVNMRPKMYTDHIKQVAADWKKSVGITGPYIMVQFSGGQTPIGWAPNNQYTSSNPGRNYHPYFAQGIINALKEKYPDHTIIDATLPNEQAYVNTIKCDQKFTVLHELLKGAKGFIGIDSCLQHFAASTGTPGIVIWGNTRWTQFGWMHHKNMSFHDKNRFNTWYKMDVSDPRNLMVDPQHVLETYVNYIHGRKIKEEDVQVAHKK